MKPPKATSQDVRGRMYAELAGYVALKRKAMEHSAEPGTGAAFVMYGERACATAKEWKATYVPVRGSSGGAQAAGEKG